jgi:ribosomal protein S18 acetylase RimI-like enzyme
MIQLARGLADTELAAIAELEARTVAADGGRLKLEWPSLRSRPDDEVRDILYWDDNRLLGFLGLYALGSPTIELAGMVDPAARRRGVATSLLNAALELCKQRNSGQVLLVTPRVCEAGKLFALAKGAAPEHCEHALALTGPPTDGPTNPAVTVRSATRADSGDVDRLLTSAFGWPHSDALHLGIPGEETLMISHNGAPVATMRLDRHGDTAGIYGFAVDPAWQGRGIGRDVLRRACRQLRDEGFSRVGLEVAVDNDHALGLYTSLGFSQVSTEDYYALTL